LASSRARTTRTTLRGRANVLSSAMFGKVTRGVPGGTYKLKV
jgi:hypothetical protein